MKGYPKPHSVIIDKASNARTEPLRVVEITKKPENKNKDQ
jgi:hypothetical protein